MRIQIIGLYLLTLFVAIADPAVANERLDEPQIINSAHVHLPASNTSADLVWTDRSRGGNLRSIVSLKNHVYFLIGSDIHVYKVLGSRRYSFVTKIRVPYSARCMTGTKDHLYVGTHCAGISVFNVKNPAGPQFVSQIELGSSPIGNMSLVGDYIQVKPIYDPNYILDISSPENPYVAAEIPYYLRSIGENDLACSVTREGEILIMDIADPTQPTLLQSWKLNSYEGPTVLMIGSFVYVHISFEDHALSYVIDIESKEMHQLEFDFRPSYVVKGMIFGRKMGRTGLYDVSDPFHPAEVLDSGISYFPKFVIKNNKVAFALDRAGNFGAVDIARVASGSQNPFTAYGNTFATSTRAIGSKYRVLTNQSELFDVSDAMAPIYLGRLDRRNAPQFHFDDTVLNDNYMYTNGFVLDISKSPKIEWDGEWNSELRFYGSHIISGDHLYDQFRNEFRIFDISDPATPYLITTKTVRDGFTADFIAADDNTVILAADRGSSRPGADFFVFDTTEPSAIVNLGGGEYGSSVGCSGVHVNGDYIYFKGSLGRDRFGIHVYNKDNFQFYEPLVSVEIPDLSGYSEMVGYQDRIYLVGKVGPIVTYDISDPLNPVISSQSEPIDCYSSGAVVAGNSLVVFNSYSVYILTEMARNRAYIDHDMNAAMSKELRDKQQSAPVANITISPNPFNPATSVSFSIDQGERVRIEVFDLKGRHVTTLTDKFYQTGAHFVDWRGRDDSGLLASSGQYFFRIEIGAEVQVKKAMLLK